MNIKDTVVASSLERVMECPGSARLSADIPQTKTKYSEEGNVAHALAAEMVQYAIKTGEREKGLRARFKRGHVIRHRDGSAPANQEMIDAAALYALRVVSHGGVVEVEVNVQHRGHARRAFADAVVSRNDARIVVIDFKYGFTPVHLVRDGKPHPQLMYYAAGAMERAGWRHGEAVLEIVQPRCSEVDPVQSHVVPAPYIRDWAENELWEALEAVDDPAAPLNPGEHCRFCPALAACPAVQAKTSSMAAADFGEVAPKSIPAVPSVPAALSKILSWAPIVDAWLRACEEQALTLMRRGQRISGFKLVRKRANREWPTESAHELHTALRRAGAKLAVTDLWAEPKLLSPAQLEKQIGKEIVNKVATKPEADLTIAAESDKREAVDPAGDFEELSS